MIRRRSAGTRRAGDFAAFAPLESSSSGLGWQDDQAGRPAPFRPRSETRSLMRVSVIVPTLNEASTIVSNLRRLRSQGCDEVIVVDASSPDGTASLARQEETLVIDSPRGRGVQQNRGAAMA